MSETHGPHPTLRRVLLTAALLAAALAFLYAPAWLGVLMLAVAAGVGFDFPDPEVAHSEHLEDRRERRRAEQRTAVTAEPLRPTGLVRAADGSLHAARSLRGHLEADRPVLVVNDVDAVWIVVPNPHRYRP